MKKQWLAWRRNWIRCGFLAGVCALCAPGFAGAQESPEQKGLAIAREAWERDRGFNDSSSELNMILRSASGQEARRELRIRSLEVSERESRAMVIFDTPQDVRGTALLTHAHTDKEDEQWLYMPAVTRTKRIAGGSRSGPFMGSEFAFEDMGSQRVEKFTYKYLREEELDGMLCHVLERYPSDARSGYSKQVAWLDKDQLRVHKVEYYDRRGDLLKTLTITGYTQYLDKHWRPARMEMLNHQTHKGTVLEWKNHTFNSGLTERDFDRNALKSAR